MHSKKPLSKFLALLMVICMSMQLLWIPASAIGQTDYTGHWAQSSIEKLLQNSIISGDDSGKINPDGNMTRAEFIKIINRTFGYTAMSDLNYPDVQSDTWYANEFRIARQAGYIQGDSNGNANPKSPITKDEVCTIIARVLGLSTTTDAKLAFSDESEIDSWAYGSVKSLFDSGFITGNPDNSFKGGNQIKRAECFTILAKIIDKGLNKSEAPTASVTPGTYYSTQTVELKSKTTGANIYYTTDDTAPTVNSTKYTSAITVNKTLNIKAIAIKDGLQASAVAIFAYTISTSGYGGGGGGGGTTYYSVSFNLNYEGATGAPAAQSVASGGHATEPTAPTRSGYTFKGWFTTSDCTTQFVFASTAITCGTVLYAKWETASIELSNFKSDEEYLLTNTDENVIFSIKVNSNIELTSNDVILYDDDNSSLDNLNDNGIDGDQAANDGTYSCQVVLNSESEKQSEFYVKALAKKSDSVKIVFFNAPTEADFSELENIRQKTLSIQEPYEDEAGFVKITDIPQILKDVSAYAQELLDSGALIDYNTSDESVWFKFASGLEYIFSPTTADVDSDGSDVSVRVITCQPCLSTYPSSLNEYMGYVDDAADEIANTFSNYSFADSDNYENDDVTLDVINHFTSNEVVLWHGHGGYNSVKHSYLVTGDNYDLGCGVEELIKGDLASTDDGKVIINSKYIDNHVGRLDNSFFYLAACSSGKDSVLADAFLDNGASAVIGNSGPIMTIYNLSMVKYTVEGLIEMNDTTGVYNSLSNALDYAKSICGEDDSVKYGGGGAYPIIFGDNEYRLSDKTINGTLSGKVCKASDRITSVPNATINITLIGGDTITKTTDASGNYSVSLPAGDYYISISADGYIEFKAYATVTANETVYMETFLMINDDGATTGIASGRILNAITGEGVAGAQLCIGAGWNYTGDVSVVEPFMTDENGNYSAELPLGNYTVTVKKAGFITTSFNIIVQSGTTTGQNGTISPEISGNTFRIVMSWGQTPADLDSHILGPTVDGTDRFHTYFENKDYINNNKTIANLDLDDTDSYGPETTTVYELNTSGVYSFYVHDYTNRDSSSSRALSQSGAQVKVYSGDTLIAVYNVPTNAEGTLWHVFDFDAATKSIKVSNNVSYTTAPGDVGKSASLINNTSENADINIIAGSLTDKEAKTQTPDTKEPGDQTPDAKLPDTQTTDTKTPESIE